MTLPAVAATPMLIVTINNKESMTPILSSTWSSGRVSAAQYV